MMAARDHIHLETYILDDDDVGQQFAQVLIDKQQQGVQVRVIRDSVGTVATPAAFFERLTANGIEVLEFNPINPLATGASPSWAASKSAACSRVAPTAPPRARPALDPAWRDTDLQLHGPVVAELHIPSCCRRRWWPSCTSSIA